MESRKPPTKDYYAVLGVSPESDSSAIKKAYRTLVQRYHPDRLRATEDAGGASERMIEINEAFAVLGDVKRRAELDRARAMEKSPPTPVTVSSVEDWEMVSTSGKAHPTPPSERNTSVEKSVAREFLDKVKAQLLQESAPKFKEEADPYWLWILLGKTWGANYWVGVRRIELLNPNAAKELTGKLQAFMDKRRSGWKSNFFVIVYAFEALQDANTVVKLIRTFANRSEHSTPRNLVNIVALDLNQRRSLLCGKKSSDPTCGAILRALGIA